MGDRRASTTRREHRPSARLALLLALLLGLTALQAVPPGSADELHQRKHKVERRIHDTHQDLDQSSAELAQSVRRLEVAVADLQAARAELAHARDELAAAEALDRKMQAALDEAVRQLSNARDALAQGREGLSRSRDELRGVAVSMQSSGGPELMALSAVFGSREPAQLTGRLGNRQSVLDKESSAVAQLQASEVVLTVQEAELEDAKELVAQRRAEAAENLELKTTLETQAEDAAGRVRELVGARRDARQEAASAKAEDLRRLRQFERERNHISQMLQRRAARARARAAAAARAKAAKAARAAAHSGASAAPAAPARSGGGGFFSYPVSGYITSPYGMRLHPVYHRWTLHDGTDFGVGCGTPIHAAANGTVVGRYYNSAYGNRVIVDHGWVRGAGLATAYNHLSAYSTYVGQHVQRGDVIGYVGTTGYSTGCHLHFMVFRNGATVNPMNWL